MIRKYIQGVPKKTEILVQWAIEGTRSGLKTKVGWVLKNSRNFLSNENSYFLWKNGWEKRGQRWLPPLKKLENFRIWVFGFFFWGGSHLWPCFSRPFFHINWEFLCSLDRKFPEFFKTHPTFVFSSLLVPTIAHWTRIPVFLGHPVPC